MFHNPYQRNLTALRLISYDQDPAAVHNHHLIEGGRCGDAADVKLTPHLFRFSSAWQLIGLNLTCIEAAYGALSLATDSGSERRDHAREQGHAAKTGEDRA